MTIITFLIMLAVVLLIGNIICKAVCNKDNECKVTQVPSTCVEVEKEAAKSLAEEPQCSKSVDEATEVKTTTSKAKPKTAKKTTTTKKTSGTKKSTKPSKPKK